MLEISIVPVPSNPNALLSAVDEGVITAKQYKSLKDTIQIICPYCGSERVEPKTELGWNFWECCKCEKTFDTATNPKSTITLEIDELEVAGKIVNDIDEIAKEAQIELDKPLSQEEIKDEIDYLKDSINDVGLSNDSKVAALELVEVIKRITGNDIPDDIKREDDVTLEQILGIVQAEVTKAIEKAQGKV